MKKFHFLSFLLLTGCLFDGSGWGNNPTITDSGTNETGTNSTTILLSDVTTSTTGIESSTGIETTGTTQVIESSTGIETTESVGSTSTGFDSTGSGDFLSSSSGSSSSSGGIPETCGDCILQRAEECDTCLYSELSKIESYCIPTDCLVGFNKSLSFRIDGTLSGMITPKYDQEEADLLCKIYLHSANAVATGYTTNSIGYIPNRLYLFTVNYQGKGVLLKSASQYYPNKPLYLFEYGEIGFNQSLDPVMYITGCELI